MNIICAYSVNIDAIYNVQGKEISVLIQSNLDLTPKSEPIKNISDLLSSLIFCMQQGSGGEILIDDKSLAVQIEEAFSWQFRLGGNAGIMANILAALGAKPVLNAPALGSRISGMLHAGILILDGQTETEKIKSDQSRNKSFNRSKNQIRGTGKKRDSEKETEMVHFVFQFKKGDVIFVGQSSITAPSDNRFIATYDPVNTKILTSRRFDDYCLENIEDINGALLSGFHLVPLKGYQEIFTKRIAQIRSWKEKNPQIFIHMEMGSFQSPVIMHFLLSLLPKIPVDSLGMNEDELAAAEELQPGLPPSGWQESMQAAMRLREKLGMFRVAVHTRDYIMSVMQQGRISAQDELIALQKGVEAATSLAATGIATGKQKAEINPLGLEAVEEFCRNGAVASGRGAFLHKGGVIVSLMPSLVVHKPRITVGLGDTATAVIFFNEILPVTVIKKYK